MWAKVTEFIERKKTKYYEYAILTLGALKFLAEKEDSLDDYFKKADGIADRYLRLVGLQWRLKEAQVVSGCEPPEPAPPSSSIYLVSWQKENPAEKEYLFSLLNE